MYLHPISGQGVGIYIEKIWLHTQPVLDFPTTRSHTHTQVPLRGQDPRSVSWERSDVVLTLCPRSSAQLGPIVWPPCLLCQLCQLQTLINVLRVSCCATIQKFCPLGVTCTYGQFCTVCTSLQLSVEIHYNGHRACMGMWINLHISEFLDNDQKHSS
jgi:hypothetical protein